MAPSGGRRWCRRCVSDVYSSSGQTQSAYAGNGKSVIMVWYGMHMMCQAKRMKMRYRGLDCVFTEAQCFNFKV